MTGLVRLLNSGIVTLLIGVALVATSVFEMVDTGLERALGIEVRVHHGIFAWGLVQIFKGLAAVARNLKDLREGVKDLGHARSRGKHDGR